MTSSPLDVVQGLAETITTSTDLTRITVLGGTAAPIFPGVWMDAPVVVPTNLGNDSLTLELTAKVFVAGDIGSNYEALLEYQALSGDRSISAAVQANRTLGLLDTDCLFTRSRPLDLTEIAAYNAFGCAFDFTARVSDPGSP